MSPNDTLTARLASAAQRWPAQIALEEPNGGQISYHELDALSQIAANQFQQFGVQLGDRVGIFMPKSIDTIAAIVGVLKTGAAYVPVDPGAPMWRAAYILSDCAVRVVVVESTLAPALRAELEKTGFEPHLLCVDSQCGGLRTALQEAGAPTSPASDIAVRPDDLAYILYTSGSTGKPKGVMLSHRNAVSFVDWCAEVFAPSESDRFSSHAPLHFDLSILDLYLPLTHGARVVLIGAELGKDPAGLAALISDRRISVWYSTPSILTLLTQYGKMERHDYAALRTVLFAGEVFPVKHLRALQVIWPQPRYFNLYGPTETNVCTFYEVIGPVPVERTADFPIGKACSHLRTRVVDEAGRDVCSGQEGELVVSGPGVMQGYWNLPDNTARAFLTDTAGSRWYRTGDIVIESADGDYIFLGRRDRMVKRRGYRIELGEIESGLYRHPAIKEAAVVAVRDQNGGVLIRAFLTCRDGQKPTVIELKRFCAETLPLYMVPDRFDVRDAIPKTSTDKTDYQRLLESA